MDTGFKKVGVGRTENGESAVVRGYAKEMLVYERHDFFMPLQITFSSDGAVIEVSARPFRLPPGLSRDEFVAELLAGARVVAKREVELVRTPWSLGAPVE